TREFQQHAEARPARLPYQVLLRVFSPAQDGIRGDLVTGVQTCALPISQLDQLAATLASPLSDQTTAGTAVTSGSQAGFDLDLSNVLPGNTINLTYTDAATNTPHQITIVRVDDPTALPLPNTAASPNDKVLGVNFTAGIASIV